MSIDLVEELCAALGEIPADTPAGEDRAAAVEAVLEGFRGAVSGARRLGQLHAGEEHTR